MKLLRSVPWLAVAFLLALPALAADPMVVNAKLVEIPGKYPPDDLYDYAYVMRYQVVGGAQDGETFPVPPLQAAPAAQPDQGQDEAVRGRQAAQLHRW